MKKGNKFKLKVKKPFALNFMIAFLFVISILCFMSGCASWVDKNSGRNSTAAESFIYGLTNQTTKAVFKAADSGTGGVATPLLNVVTYGVLGVLALNRHLVALKHVKNSDYMATALHEIDSKDGTPKATEQINSSKAAKGLDLAGLSPKV